MGKCVFGSSVEMNYQSIQYHYLTLCTDKIREEKAIEFVKDNPLIYNGKYNRYQNFEIN